MFLILALSQLICIFERPYYEFSFPDIPYRQFGSLSASIWYVVITMASVGYGDEIATTPVGRFLALCAILIGVVMLSTMVALISNLLKLNEQQALASNKVKDQLACAKAI